MRSTVIISLVVLIIFSCAAARAERDAPFTARITRVVDGDTWEFRAAFLNIELTDTCRAEAYNAPETKGVEKSEGIKATELLRGLVEGKEVRIAVNGKDKYGRWLCRLWLPDGTSVDEIMRRFLDDFPGRDKYLSLSPKK